MRRQLTAVRETSYRVFFAGGLLLGLCALTGCGGGDENNGTTSSGASSNPGTDSTDGGTAAAGGSESQAGPKKVASSEAYIDENGRIWLTPEIPLDVFYQDPLQVARQEGNVSNAPSGDPMTPPEVAAVTTPSAGDPGETATPASTGPNWKDVVAAEVLDNEVKKVTNRLRAKLKTLATYNASYLELPPHIATMAALAGIASQYPGDVRWKPEAKHIRDLAASMLAETPKRGRKSYDLLNEPYLKINDILAGSSPAGLPEPNEAESLSDYAEMGLLMQRFDIGSKWLQVNVGTVESLKENAADVQHEASVLAALATAITTEGYGFVEDPEFKGHARGMVAGCKKVQEAAAAGNLEEFQLGFSAINQACTKCHGTYR